MQDPPANSHLGQAKQALRKAQDEVTRAEEEAEGQPRLSDALAETVVVLEDQQAAIELAAQRDVEDGEESGAAAQERADWRPPSPG